VRAAALIAATLAVIALASSALAAGSEVTRGSYREAAEPICRVDTQANERILAGVKAEVRAGRLGPPAAKFARAAKALHKALGQLEALPRPSADQVRLAKWFQTVASEAGYFEVVSRKLGAGQKASAEHYVNKLTTTAAKANNQVLPFEFTYCRLEPSRFT
jgi:hypothetical protein